MCRQLDAMLERAFGLPTAECRDAPVRATAIETAMNVSRVRSSDEASVHHRPASNAGQPNDPGPAKRSGSSCHRLPVTR